MHRALTVKCPACARPTEYSASNRWRPFCSERCRGADLGAWASERFRIPSQTGPGDGDDERLTGSDPPPVPPGG